MFLSAEQVNQATLEKIAKLNAIAQARGQSLAQMAISWLHKEPVTSSVIIGASRLSQIEDCVKAQDAAPLSAQELRAIDEAAGM